jgi:hypothetical protein
MGSEVRDSGVPWPLPSPHPNGLGRDVAPPDRPFLLTARKMKPVEIPAACAQSSTACLTQLGIGTVRPHTRDNMSDFPRIARRFLTEIAFRCCAKDPLRNVIVPASFRSRPMPKSGQRPVKSRWGKRGTGPRPAKSRSPRSPFGANREVAGRRAINLNIVRVPDGTDNLCGRAKSKR